MKPIESITCPSCNVEFRREDVPPSHLCPVCGAHLYGSRTAGAESAGTAAAEPDAPPTAAKPPLSLKDWELIAKTLVGLVAAVLIAVSLFTHSAEDEARQKRQAAAKTERAAKTAHLAPGQCVTEGGHFAAVSEELLDRVNTYHSQRDLAAIEKLLASGMVITLAKGKTVYVDYSSRHARIRPPGETAELWTDATAVTCK
ncbi:hypothetical protein G3N56_07690 [Desulfovibrio sulfodismutans]|uniref:Uncharacterized protein n=1 Tax=Desulfolutivibrio sulfodismutans TaxID=63561 RepID=A0A7K3NK99_9BACT|nr:hypothetical protein [Desulfolutivibrio sulfodismutans]NDY56624.1 hypothetical protein [Desulfolutivibrio sulfodismutans]QLA11275.1 hypothetical protein GD606_02765 [Desulfolutivibrio sulfodismutans DSM 3696]